MPFGKLLLSEGRNGHRYAYLDSVKYQNARNK